MTKPSNKTSTRKRAALEQYVSLAGNACLHHSQARRQVEKQLDKLNLSNATEERLLAMAYAAAYVVRSVKETAICNRARGRVQKSPLSPYLPLDGIWKGLQLRDPQGWVASRPARHWAFQSDRARRATLLRLADLAKDLSSGLFEVTAAPSFRPLLPSVWGELVEAANLPQRVADVGKEICGHLTDYRAPRRDRSNARLQAIYQLIAEFRVLTGAPRFALIQDLLYLLTDGVSRATPASLKQDEQKYLQLLKRDAGAGPVVP